MSSYRSLEWGLDILQRFFGKGPRSRPVTSRLPRRVRVESLECRTLMSATTGDAGAFDEALQAKYDQFRLGDASSCSPCLDPTTSKADALAAEYASFRLGDGLDSALPSSGSKSSPGPCGFDETLLDDALASLGDATPSGLSYLLHDNWGGAWCDAEKTYSNTDDDLLCWAATTSNMLQWTGWGNIDSMNTTDAIFAYFQNHWSDQGGLMHFGLDWWFDGTNPSQGWSGWAQVESDGGGFYPNENLNDYMSIASASGSTFDALSYIDSYLHEGKSIGLGIYGPGGHAITCWGYNYSEAGDYLGVWVTDSDDYKHLDSPPDTLRYYEVDNVGGKWYLQDYYGSDAWYIDYVVGLAQKEGSGGDEPVDPAPAPTDTGIRGTVFEDTNDNGQLDQGEPGSELKTVYIDNNGNEQWDTGQMTYVASQTPVNIVDLTTVTSTITLSGTGKITDLDVILDITHTWDSDLIISLVSPEGTEVMLVNQVGGSGDNFSGTTLDDEAATGIASGTAPFSGSYRPSSALSAFDGENMAGDWTLKVYDTYSWDDGVLNAWGMTIEADELWTTTDASGNYEFLGLAPGDYDVRAIPGGSLTVATPASGTQSATVTAGQVVENVDFALRPYVTVPAVTEARLDFGTASSAVASGFTQVTAATSYSAGQGYGWTGGTVRDIAGATGNTTDAGGDCNYVWDATFLVDVANGTYDVTIVSGWDNAHEQQGVYLEGTLAGTMEQPAGQWVTSTFTVTVSDGQLNLRFKDFGGANPVVVINSLVITESTASPSTRFDFGTAASAVASGYTQVTAATSYSEGQGYGWTGGTVRDIAGATGNTTDAGGDCNYVWDATFLVDITNGTYDVTIVSGWDNAHEQQGVYLEGTLAGTMEQPAGQWVTSTFTVTVSDGQLNLRLKDFGGANPVVVINSLVITEHVAMDTTYFDFGSATSSIADGDKRVTKTTTYTADRGYGWSAGAVVREAVGAQGSTDADRYDCNYVWDATFLIDVPDGTYDVRIVSGWDNAHENQGVYLEGTLAGTIDQAAGEWITSTFTVTVADGQLTMRFKDLGGNNPVVVINSISITQHIGSHGLNYDFGPAASPVVGGYRQVTAATQYNASLGYGWSSGTVNEASGAVGATDVGRSDCLYASDATFLMDIANGTYDVTIVSGWDNAHDQQGVYLEGSLAGTIEQPAGEWIASTFTVTVSDGQLSMRFKDLGGNNPVVVINSFSIIPSS